MNKLQLYIALVLVTWVGGMAATAIEIKEAAHLAVLDGDGEVWVGCRLGCASGTPATGWFAPNSGCSTAEGGYTSLSSGCTSQDNSCSPQNRGCSTPDGGGLSTGKWPVESSTTAEGASVDRHRICLMDVVTWDTSSGSGAEARWEDR